MHDLTTNVPWLLELAGFFLLILAINSFLRRALDRFKHKLHPQKSSWLAQIDYPILTPIKTLFWLLFLFFSIHLLIQRLGMDGAIPDPTPLRNAGIIVCLTWSCFRWKKILQEAAASHLGSGKKPFDLGSIEMIGKIYTIGVLFIALLALLQVLGLSIAPLLAFGGIGAAALGFASRDVIANFYGGLTIYLTRPFTLSDLIELPQKQLTGTIEKIGWYFTTLRDTSKKPVYIPNAVFATELVINLSRMTHRRIEEKLSLRYADAQKIEELNGMIRQYLVKNPEIDQTLPIHVFIHTFSESSIELEIKVYTSRTSYEEFMEIKQQIMLRICEMMESAGIDIGYPVREIHLRDEFNGRIRKSTQEP